MAAINGSSHVQFTVWLDSRYTKTVISFWYPSRACKLSGSHEILVRFSNGTNKSILIFGEIDDRTDQHTN